MVNPSNGKTASEGKGILRQTGMELLYPGSRKPRPLAVDECANFWPACPEFGGGCRPTRALVRCHGFARGAPPGRRIKRAGDRKAFPSGLRIGEPVAKEIEGSAEG